MRQRRHRPIRSIAVIMILWGLVLASHAVAGTAPRFSPKLLKPEEGIKIFAYPYPPLIDPQMPGLGIAASIVKAAFEEADIRVEIEALPVKSLAKHSVLYDNALAVLGEAHLFSKSESRDLTTLPCYEMTRSLYRYRPVQGEGNDRGGQQYKLKGSTCGVPTGDDVTPCRKAGMNVIPGDMKSLLRKLKEKEIDVLVAPDVILKYYVRKFYAGENDSFIKTGVSIQPAPFVLFFKRTNPHAEKLTRIYAKGLKRIKQNRKYEQILAEYEEERPSRVSETYISTETRGIVEFGSSDTPPFWSPALQKDGMAGEILHAIFSEINMRSRIHYFPMKRLLTDRRNNHLGDPDNFSAQRFSAVVPIALYRAAFFYYKPKHKNGITYRTPADLRGYTIGVIRGTLENKGYFEKNVIKVVEANNEASLFRLLKEGRIDLCVVIRETGAYTVNKEFPREVDKFAPVEIPNSVGSVAVMIDWNYPDGRRLGARIEEGLKKIIGNGKYFRILKKYYGEGNVPADWLNDLEHFSRKYQHKP